MHEGYGTEGGMAAVRAAERRKKKATRARERKKRRQRKKMTRGRVIGRPAKKPRADTATSSERRCSIILCIANMSLKACHYVASLS